LTFIASRVTAYSIGAVRSAGVKFSAADRTGIIVSRLNIDADRCSSTVVAGVVSVCRVTASWLLL